MINQLSCALVLGVGPELGLGATLARYFAKKGLHVFIAGRHQDRLDIVAESIRITEGSVTPVVADATEETDIAHLFDLVRLQQMPLSIAVYNVDSNIPLPILHTEPETFLTLWKQNCFGAFLFAKSAIPYMKKGGMGTLFFTGATASLRAKPPFTAFSSAKAALRHLAQGLAREFGPERIHVVHTIIDGVINGDRAAEQFPRLVQAKGEDGLLKLEAIAETYWAIHNQHPSTWTHELDLRPFKEPF